MPLTAPASFPIFSNFSDVVSPLTPAMAAPMMSVVHASSTRHSGRVLWPPEFLRTKLSDCATWQGRPPPQTKKKKPGDVKQSKASFGFGAVCLRQVERKQGQRTGRGRKEERGGRGRCDDRERVALVSSSLTLAYSLLSPLQSIMFWHFICIASSRLSMYCFTDGSAMTKSMANAVGAPVVNNVVACDAM